MSEPNTPPTPEPWFIGDYEILPRATYCPGGGQAPRNPESDRRPLWSGRPNPHLPEDDYKQVFTHCNVCGIKLRTKEEDQMGMCDRCAAE